MHKNDFIIERIKAIALNSFSMGEWKMIFVNPNSLWNRKIKGFDYDEIISNL
jgi:hypothetical protein